MLIKNIKGLKYPDEYFVRFFFKNKLHNVKELRFLEFGCGNGSNLMLPFHYDHNVIGIDYDENLISYAKENFAYFNKNEGYNFYVNDMRKFAEKTRDLQADIFSLPNIINYIPKDDFVTFLKTCRNNKLYKEGSKLFIRFRSPQDFRYGFGQKIDKNTYLIDENNNATGEAGALNCFYTSISMVEILQTYLYLQDFELFNINFENKNVDGDIILNSDIVIWGSIS